MIDIIVLGDNAPDWVLTGFTEYKTRLRPHLKIEYQQIPRIIRKKSADITQILQQEGEKILRFIKPDDWVIALDTAGTEFDNLQLAKKFEQWLASGKNIKFIIGAPEGMPDACLERANVRWSLSKLTLPHTLVQVVLIEQIYRSMMILQGHPYHK